MREKQKEDDLKKQNDATTKIQSLYRRHDALSKVDKIRKDRKMEKIVTDLQTLYRGYIARKGLEKQKDATKQIQTWYKNRLKENQNKAKEKVATNLQALFRGNNAREEMKKLRNATGVLQKTYRGHLARNQIEKMREKQKEEDLKKQNDASTKIQSLYRRHDALSKVDKIRKERKLVQNVTDVQKLYRGKFLRQALNFIHNKARVIQKNYRGHMVRSQTEKMREKHKEDDLIERDNMESNRMLLHKFVNENNNQINKHDLNKQNDAKEKVNEDNEEFLQIEKKFDNDFKREAAMKLQALQRGHNTRKEYAKNLQEKNSAATTIVKNYRRYIAQRNFVKRQESAKKEDSAANIINSYFKKYVTKIKEDRERKNTEKKERERQKSKEIEDLDIWKKNLHRFLQNVDENKEKHPIDIRSVSAPPRRPDENIVPNTERAIFYNNSIITNHPNDVPNEQQDTKQITSNPSTSQKFTNVIMTKSNEAPKKQAIIKMQEERPNKPTAKPSRASITQKFTTVVKSKQKESPTSLSKKNEAPKKSAATKEQQRTVRSQPSKPAPKNNAPKSTSQISKNSVGSKASTPPPRKK